MFVEHQRGGCKLWWKILIVETRWRFVGYTGLLLAKSSSFDELFGDIMNPGDEPDEFDELFSSTAAPAMAAPLQHLITLTSRLIN